VLPGDVWVESARRTRPDFHPRYDALARTYVYRLGLAQEASSPFHKRWCWPIGDGLDRRLLEEAAGRLPGERSFRAFCKAGQPERGYRCRVDHAGWTTWSGIGLAFTITANRYLHHMVRYLVGTMVETARGRRSPGEFPLLLEGAEGALKTSPPAPPQGLFLTRVDYPERVWEADK
jgi:tRNA pseudouridine38-40 synthase